MGSDFSPDFLKCTEHDHAVDHVWISEQQQGVYSRRTRDTFHCGKCALITASSARGENWRPVPIGRAIEMEAFRPCKLCLPKAAHAWRGLLEWARQTGQF
jgi:hypothetical protein